MSKNQNFQPDRAQTYTKRVILNPNLQKKNLYESVKLEKNWK